MGEAGKKPERESEGETCEGEGRPIDTPERDRVAAPVSQSEDSPLFNYIVNLSPINTANPMRLSQTLNPLNLASPPPIFTSPHVSSLKGCTLLRRYNFSDPSIPEPSSENKVGNNEIMEVTNQKHNTPGPARFMVENTVKTISGSSSPAIDISRFLNDSGGSPICCATPSNGYESLSSTRLAGTSLSAFSQVSGRDSEGNDAFLERSTNIVQNNEAARCDWESLVTNASDLLIFASPNDAEAFSFSSHKPKDYDGKFCSSHASEFKPDDQNDLHEKQCVIQFEEHKSDPPEQAGLECHIALKDASEELVAGTSLNDSVAEVAGQQTDNELVSRLHRGMKRRCLVFETVGSRIKHLDDSASSGSSVMAQPDRIFEHSDKHPVSVKPGNDSSRRTLPGIGLHLNALSRNSKEFNIANDTLAATKPLINKPSSSSSLQSVTTNQEPLKKCSTVPSVEKTTALAECVVKETDAAALASGCIVIECNQSSPKKRHKLENAEGSEGCKRCNCKKSKCLKLYCDCFAAGLYCVEPCSCQDCFNKPLHEDTVLATRKQIESRNPLAFAPKVIRNSDSVPEIGDDSSKTPASARHKRGCNCKRSGCLKKYCECYQSGVGCSINCRCEGCKNAFGRKDGSASMGTEMEVEAEHKDPSDKCVTNRNLKTAIPNSDGQKRDSKFTASPSRPSRMSVQMPFNALGKPPPSSLLSLGSSSAYNGGQRFDKPHKVQPHPKVDKHIPTVDPDEIPRILQGNNCSPIGVKSASPNSKRVSPPHYDCGSSSPPPSRRPSSRKLILQSIPLFPPLTPKH